MEYIIGFIIIMIIVSALKSKKIVCKYCGKRINLVTRKNQVVCPYCRKIQ